MIKRIRVTQKGTFKPLIEEFKKGGTGILQKLAAKEDFELAAANTMRDVIKKGKTFRSLRKSTREIRQDRRKGKGLERTVSHDIFGSKRRQKPKHLSKPLFETGQLYNSIKQIHISANKFRKDPEIAVSFYKYGLYQANGFIVKSSFRGMSGADELDRVTRTAAKIATGKKQSAEDKQFYLNYPREVENKLAEFKRKKMSTKQIQSSVSGRSVPPRDFITVANKEMSKYIIKAFKKEFPKHIAKTLRPNIIINSKG